MKVRNISNTKVEPGKYFDHKTGTIDETYMLTPGREYIIFAFLNTPDKLKYYLILDDANQDTEIKDIEEHMEFDPNWYPSSLFGEPIGDVDPVWQKIDRRISMLERAELYSFPELIDNEDFIASVSDGEEKNQRIFSSYLKKYLQS